MRLHAPATQRVESRKETAGEVKPVFGLLFRL